MRQFQFKVILNWTKTNRKSYLSVSNPTFLTTREIFQHKNTKWISKPRRRYNAVNSCIFIIPNNIYLNDICNICIYVTWYWDSYTEKTIFLFPFTLNGIWSWWQFPFRCWTKWNSIWLKIKRKTVTTIITVKLRLLSTLKIIQCERK